MTDFNIDMTYVVFFALFGMASLTILVAAGIVKAITKAYDIWDRYQYVKHTAGLYRN